MKLIQQIKHSLRSLRRRGTASSAANDMIPETLVPFSPTHLAALDFHDHFLNEYYVKHITNGTSVAMHSTEIIATRDSWNAFVATGYRDFRVAMTSAWGGFVTNNDSLLVYMTSRNSVNLKLYGANTELLDIALKQFEEVGSQVEWVYSERGDSISLPLDIEHLPTDSMYPNLNGRTLKEYYDAFLQSRSNILLLIGPPGTGKTSFLRGLMHHAQASAILTYDSNILGRDNIFADFMEGEHGMMIMEDADTFLGSRAEGNTLISRFLNVGDGLISTHSKKLIFSTNLPSVKDIDEALLRPGRCFDVLEFDMLTQAEAEKLAKEFNIELNETRAEWTLAEVFNSSTDVQNEFTNVKKMNRSIGFV